MTDLLLRPPVEIAHQVVGLRELCTTTEGKPSVSRNLAHIPSSIAHPFDAISGPARETAPQPAEIAQHRKVQLAALFALDAVNDPARDHVRLLEREHEGVEGRESAQPGKERSPNVTGTDGRNMDVGVGRASKIREFLQVLSQSRLKADDHAC